MSLYCVLRRFFLTNAQISIGQYCTFSSPYNPVRHQILHHNMTGRLQPLLLTMSRKKVLTFTAFPCPFLANATFTLSGFDDQERNLTFVKAAFQVLNHPLHKQNIARVWQQKNTILQAFRSVSGCQTCMCKRGISHILFFILLKPSLGCSSSTSKLGHTL